jgi:acyl-CoA synthetase (AMP-forming)/AMP-acid ligase II
MNLYDTFEQNALAHPHKPALVYYDAHNWQTLSYNDVLEEARIFSRGLESCGLAPGMRTALMSPPDADFFPFALALLKFGIIPVLVEPAIGIKKLGEIFAEAQPEIFIGNGLTHALRVVFEWGKKTVKHRLTVAHVRRRGLNAPQSFIDLSPVPSSAAIIYTSGSTGLPKGAVYTQENLSAQLQLLRDAFHITPDEIDLPAFPLYALIDLFLGVTSVIPDITFPIPRKTNPAKVIDAIQEFHVTNMFASPVVLDILAEYGAARAVKLPSLNRIITAGAPASINLQRHFRQLLEERTDLFGIYGATETLPIAKIESREIFALQERTTRGAGICLGKPLAGVTVRIVPITEEAFEEWNDSFAEPANVVGEIVVQSSATTRAYFNRPESNRAAKIPHGQEIFHRMGDVGYFDNDGLLWYCGRKSHRVTTPDGVFFTEQIEHIFNAHPQVFRTALVGVDGQPVLWVELKKRAHVNADTIRHELMELASGHSQAATIKTFLFMKKFPTDVRHNSKIIRERLAELAKKKI